MARPREFDIDDAIADAVEVFWERGYDGAALPDLLDGMGIARGSLYKAFGDKKHLYLAALERYDAQAVTQAVEMLSDERQPDGHKRIAGLFQSILDAVRGGDRRGCLMCNAAAGPASQDADIAAAVSEMLARMTQAFATALSASGPGRPRPAKDTRDCQARGLTAAYVGLRILAKSGAPLAELEAAASSALAMINSKPVKLARR